MCATDISQCGAKENLINKRGSITDIVFDSSQFIPRIVRASVRARVLWLYEGFVGKAIDHPTRNRFVTLYICRENQSSNGDCPSRKSKAAMSDDRKELRCAIWFSCHSLESWLSAIEIECISLQDREWIIMHTSIYARLFPTPQISEQSH